MAKFIKSSPNGLGQPSALITSLDRKSQGVHVETSSEGSPKPKGAHGNSTRRERGGRKL